MITTLAALCIATQGTPVEMRLMRFPAVHGDEIVFTYASDLWIASRGGNSFARRLTSHPGAETRAYFSPDGSMVAFSAQYDGNQDIYVMPSGGGEPKRLTFEPEQDICAGWTPDGKIAYTSSHGSFTNRQRKLWLINPNGGMPQETPVAEAADVCFSPDGSKVAYNRQGSNRFNWRRYRGGSQGVISIYDLKSNTYKELPHERENSWNPMWIGNSIYYASDKNEQTVNLYRYDLGSGKTTQLTHYGDADIKWPSTDGKTIVFERDGFLYNFDVASGQAERVAPKVVGDLLAARPQLRRLGTQIGNISLSPTGVRVAVEARGEIFSVPVKHGDTRDIPKTSGTRERFPSWSPDGKTIAFTSDESGEYQIYTVPQLGGTPKKVSNHKGASMLGIQWSPDNKHILFTTYAQEICLADITNGTETVIFKDPYGPPNQFDFSPDGKWVAYIGSGKNQFGALYLYNVETGKSTQVTEGYYRDDDVAFDLSGKYLYLISSRTINATSGDYEDNIFLNDVRRVYVLTLDKATKNPLTFESDEEPAGGGAAENNANAVGKSAGQSTKAASGIDLDGLANRMIALPMPAGQFATIIGDNSGVIYITDGGVFKFDLKTKQSVPLLAGFNGRLSFNPSRTKVAWYTNGQLGVADVHPNIAPGEGKVDTNDVEAVVDPRQEWKQIFWDAWRYERDNFYDKNFLGMDWNAIGQRYAKYLPYVSHRDDLNYVIALMIGEWGTSHSYVNGGDYGAPVTNIPIGQLGADFDVTGGKVRFKKIYRGEQFEDPRRGPLGEPGVTVNEGDYLLAVNGQPVDSAHNPDQYLIDKANKTVSITVNSTPSLEGARTVQVRPIASEDQLRYIEWVEANRQMVSKASNGRIGYMHVPDTSDPGFTEFLKGYYSQSDKDALIVDERWNGGGHVPTFFIEKLARTYMTSFKQRNGADIGLPTGGSVGPKVMLINGYAGSGGDMFPYLFKKYGLGPLMGERTWGGLVGYSGQASLVDGGFLSAPSAAFYDPSTGQWIAENTGIDPDVEIDARPDLVAKGQDPQLQAAIDHLLKELQKNPAKPWKQPTYRQVKSGGG